MRTVTFSNPEIIKTLNAEFVCAWVNKRPDEPFEHLPDKAGCGLAMGAGFTNVTSVFCASDGTVIHAMPGFLSIIDFKNHLNFARALHARLYDPRIRGGERFAIHADAHLKAAERAGTFIQIAAHREQALKWMWTDVMPLDFFDRISPSGG